MNGFAKLFVIGSAALSASAQLVNTDQVGSWFTWNHNYHTNLYTITRVTPATLAPGNTNYYNGLDWFRNWTKRVGLAWYFDRICPCNFGCDPRFCTWCANDNRLPEWYSRSLPTDVEGAEPLNMGPLYDCNDPLDTGVVIKMEPVRNDWDKYEAHVTTDSVIDERHKTVFVHLNRGTGNAANNAKWDQFEVRDILIYLRETTPVATDISEYYFAEGVIVSPPGIKYTTIWWSYTYNMEKAWGGYSTLRAVMGGGTITLPSNTQKDGLSEYVIYRQAVSGSVLIDLVTQAADGSPYITWQMSIPRANYFVYISSNDNDGWNYYYPKVNEILCGGATNPPTCRTHDQLKGRIVQRVHGLWEGFVAPFLNRTIYAWDRDNTNYEDRFNAQVWAVDRIAFDGKKAALYDQWDRGVGVHTEGLDYYYNAENPMFSYKLY